MMLYCRMVFLLLVGLYTSRVVLAQLGQEDFGVYNAVGGVVALFSVISGALSSAISRFLTFEMGSSEHDSNGGTERLRQVFRSSVMIQLIIGTTVLVLAELIGVWFLNSKMVIPDGRMGAANWVLQCSIVTFVINLLSVPYNAAIIAHERMKAFAYIGIFEGLAKLGVAFLLATAPIDMLVWYAALMCLVAIAVRGAYSIYCTRSFPECRKGKADAARSESEGTGALMKQMISFAGWNFIGASSAVLRDHGGNILINVFCGPAVNAARGLTTQLSGAVQGFVNNFMTALNPQITKSYASGDTDYLMKIVFRGAKFSFFLLMMISMPLIMNMDFVLDIWLKDVPAHTASFVILALLFAISESLSNPLVTTQLATGNIKKYQIIVGGLQLLNVPVSWTLLAIGLPPEAVLVTAIVISQICLFARLVLLRSMVGLDAAAFMKDVYLRTVPLLFLAAAIPYIIQHGAGSEWSIWTTMNDWGGFILSALVCLVCSSLAILCFGLTSEEKEMISSRIFK